MGDERSVHMHTHACAAASATHLIGLQLRHAALLCGRPVPHRLHHDRVLGHQLRLLQ